ASATIAGYGLIAATNGVLLVWLTLNGWLVYLLAWDRTGDRLASLVAGVIFGGSPFVFTHLLGHFNLIAAWGLPLFLFCRLRARERTHAGWAVFAAISAVAVAYTDYYYLMYCAMLTAGVIGWPIVPLRLAWRRTVARGALRRALLILLGLAMALAALIL